MNVQARKAAIEKYVLGAVDMFGAMARTDICKCLDGYFNVGYHDAEIGAAITRMVKDGRLEVYDKSGPRGGARYQQPGAVYGPFDPKCTHECRHCGGLT